MSFIHPLCAGIVAGILFAAGSARTSAQEIKALNAIPLKIRSENTSVTSSLVGHPPAETLQLTVNSGSDPAKMNRVYLDLIPAKISPDHTLSLQVRFLAPADLKSSAVFFGSPNLRKYVVRYSVVRPDTRWQTVKLRLGDLTRQNPDKVGEGEITTLRISFWLKNVSPSVLEIKDLRWSE